MIKENSTVFSLSSLGLLMMGLYCVLNHAPTMGLGLMLMGLYLCKKLE